MRMQSAGIWKVLLILIDLLPFQLISSLVLVVVIVLRMRILLKFIQMRLKVHLQKKKLKKKKWRVVGPKIRLQQTLLSRHAQHPRAGVTGVPDDVIAEDLARTAEAFV